MSTETKDERKARCEALLREVFNKPGCEVIAIVRSVARSNMSAVIEYYDRETLLGLSPAMAEVLGWRNTGEGLRVHGCGLDRVHWALYTTLRALGYSDPSQLAAKIRIIRL